MFPVLLSDEEKKSLSHLNIPESIPIDFVKRHEISIKQFFGKSVDELKDKGLHPREICAAMYNIPLKTYFGKDSANISDEQTVFALNMIQMHVNEFLERK